jgi:hypothetical protein
MNYDPGVAAEAGHGEILENENKMRCPTGTILHGENEVFQRNRNDFPKVSFTLDVI